MKATTDASPRDVYIDSFTFEEFVEMAARFHGYAAPGLILGGFMVAEAKRRLPEGILFDAVCETSWCLPDCIQMLTPCTIGNGWLKIVHLGLYAMSLYDKTNGKGVRVAVDPTKLAPYPTIAEWLLKLKPKREQDSALLRQEMRVAGHSICEIREVDIREEMLSKRTKGRIAICPVCGQAYPSRDGAVCRFCQGESPYSDFQPEIQQDETFTHGPKLRMVKAEEAVGQTLMHDMTGIAPGKTKGAVFHRKQKLDVGDVCRLHRIGRFHVYVEDNQNVGEEWIHEDDAAKAMSGRLIGKGIIEAGPVREGKVTLRAEHDGLLLVDTAALERFNSIPGVMCATRHNFSVVKEGQDIAAARAIPLFIERVRLNQALHGLGDAPTLNIAKITPRKTGILVTGTEVFQGLVEDRFAPIVRTKVESFGCEVVATEVVPDDRERIADTVRDMLEKGAELIITTAGLSVDPEDVTRKGLVDAGATDLLYGVPLLPGAMSLLARAGDCRIIGVPACALYYKTTSFDILLPRVLADQPVTRRDLASLGHGGFCHSCKNCTYPKCSFAK